MFKRIVASVILAFLALIAFAQEITTVEFVSNVLDMGTYPSDSCLLTKEFTFTNTGKHKLYFLSSSPDCSCIHVELPRGAVLPGKTGKIKIVFDGKGKPEGYFLSWIYFQANTTPDHFRMRFKATKAPTKRPNQVDNEERGHIRLSL